jgi:glycosyltransferase involved in cell wall biosynthesis
MKIIAITGQHPKDTTGGSELQAYFIAKELQQTNQQVIFCAVDAPLTTYEVEEAGLKYVGIHQKYLFSRALAFQILLRKERPDIVYIRTLNSFWWIHCICKYYRIPTIYHTSSITHCKYATATHLRNITCDKLWLKTLKKYLKQDFYIFFSRFANIIISQTNEQRQLWQKIFNINSVIINNGHYCLSKIPLKDSKTFNVFWIGKYWKNPEVFIKLYDRIKGETTVHFHMIGLFPDSEIKHFTSYENKNINFHFHGQLPHFEVTKQLEKAHLLVNTSDYEGFSNTFIEAWQRGVPIISFKVDPDGILEKRKLGYLSRTLLQMEKDILTLFHNREIYDQYSQRVFLFANENYNIQKTVRELTDLVENYLGLKKTSCK